MTLRITLGNWTEQQGNAKAIRYDVFVLEQKIPVEDEWDEMDEVSVHAIAYDEGKAIGTGRLLPDGHIGRMAVKKSARRNGAGGLILAALIDESKRRGDKGVLLHAQLHASTFYERFGFVREGEEFDEVGIPHILMRCRF
jgi:predicted GNAT family N-acyltransferase